MWNHQELKGVFPLALMEIKQKLLVFERSCPEQQPNSATIRQELKLHENLII